MWVQTDGPCEVTVRAAGAPPASERTFTVEGYHYALVHVTGLPANAATPYEVTLDGEVVWPEPDSEFPPSVLRTHTREDAVRIVFGSCRVAAPHEPPYTLRKDEDDRGPRGRRAARVRAADDAHRAGGVAARAAAARRPGLRRRGPPGRRGQARRRERRESYDDYVDLYCAAWGEPVIRWLLSTVPAR